MGALEIARAMGKLYRAYRTLLDAARSRRPSAVVLIDWPDFNMRLAKTLHREGFKIIYYISPQVWAWRRYRVRALRRDVDRMLVILPFEEEFYKSVGVEAQYVGHPLTEAVHPTLSRNDFCRRHGLDPARPILALLPGSRETEIHYHLPVMLEAARRLRIANFGLRTEESRSGGLHLNPKSQISDFTSQISDRKSKGPQFVIPLASTVRREQVELSINQAKSRPLTEAGSHDDLSVTVIKADTYNALSHADFAVVASGTATVEAALAGTPMVIIYRGSELNWRLIRPLIHLDTIGMVNLIAGRRIMPELLQHDVSGARIAREVEEILSDPVRLKEMRRDLEQVRERLESGGGSGADRAARAVMETINN
jgi:lipid-A-disaccharide synthase